MNAVRWLLFDVGDVLCLSQDDAWPDELAVRWSVRLGLDVDEFQKRLGCANLPDTANSSGVIDEFWERLTLAVGASQSDSTRMRSEFWDAYCGELNLPLVRYLRRLLGQVGLAILSNSSDGAREEEEKRFGFSSLFNPICYSHEIGVSKPDPRAFLGVLAMMGANANEVVFIDNIRSNIEAAESLGMTGVLYRSHEETIAKLSEILGSNDVTG